MAEGEKWRWVEGGLEIQGDMRAYAPDFTAQSLGDFSAIANRNTEIRAILESARQAFAGGLVPGYAGACGRLHDLLAEIRIAKREWASLMDRLGAFFIPQLNLHGLTYLETEAFAIQATTHLAERIQKAAAAAKAKAEGEKVNG